MARTRGAAMLALSSAVLLGALCEAPVGTSPSNLPPETYLSISDADLDTTFYVLDLSWWGEDADGHVTRFEYWWDLFRPDIPGTTTTTDTFEVEYRREVFTLPVLGRNAEHVFNVRAIDDDGLADPSPVAQSFHVQNFLSRVSFGVDLERPTRSLPGVTFSLQCTDPDGGDTILGYIYWFEGQDRVEDSRFVEAGTAARITLGPEVFPTSGTVTVHFQSIDESYSTSADTASHTWEVIDVEGKRALLVDHHPDAFQFGAEIDAFYRDALTRAYGDDAVIDLSIETDGAFQTREEVTLAFSAFEAVVWYSGIQPSNDADSRRRRSELRTATRGLQEHAELGGQTLIQSQFAFGDLFPGQDTVYAAWDSVQALEFLDVEWPYEFSSPTPNTNFSFFPNVELQTAPAYASAPLRAVSPLRFQELSPLPPGGTALTWFPPGSVTIAFDGQGQPIRNAESYHAGYELELPAGGRFIAILLPLSRMDGNGSAVELIDALVARMESAATRPRRTGPAGIPLPPEIRRRLAER